MMKIMIDGRGALWYRGTGIGTYTYQLLKHLDLLDRQNHYMVLYPTEEKCDLFSHPNFQIQNLQGTQDDTLTHQEISHLLKQQPQDLYHIPQNGIGLPREKNCSFVITLHDVIPYVLPETCSRGYLKTFMEQMERIAKLVDKVITVSEYSKQDIYQVLGIPLSKIYVTPLAPEPIYRPLDKKECKAYIAKKYGIDRDYILYIGGLNPRKNIGSMIDAYAMGKKHLTKDYCMVIGGKLGRSYENLYRHCASLALTKDVLFPGYIPLEELPIFYNGASLFVYPSLYEGFGLPPLEAMACGTPTICSNVTSIPEVVGEGALLVAPHDIEELSLQMIHLLEDENFAQSMIHRGWMQCQKYSWEETAKKTLKIYHY